MFPQKMSVEGYNKQKQCGKYDFTIELMKSLQFVKSFISCVGRVDSAPDFDDSLRCCLLLVQDTSGSGETGRFTLL